MPKTACPGWVRGGSRVSDQIYRPELSERPGLPTRAKVASQPGSGSPKKLGINSFSEHRQPRAHPALLKGNPAYPGGVPVISHSRNWAPGRVLYSDPLRAPHG